MSSCCYYQLWILWTHECVSGCDQTRARWSVWFPAGFSILRRWVSLVYCYINDICIHCMMAIFIYHQSWLYTKGYYPVFGYITTYHGNLRRRKMQCKYDCCQYDMVLKWHGIIIKYNHAHNAYKCIHGYKHYAYIHIYTCCMHIYIIQSINTRRIPDLSLENSTDTWEACDRMLNIMIIWFYVNPMMHQNEVSQRALTHSVCLSLFLESLYVESCCWFLLVSRVPQSQRCRRTRWERKRWSPPEWCWMGEQMWSDPRSSTNIWAAASWATWWSRPSSPAQVQVSELLASTDTSGPGMAIYISYISHFIH